MMKRIIIILIVILFASNCFAAAETLYTIKDVQERILRSSHAELLYGPDINVILTGTVAEIRSVDDLWFIYRIECDEQASSAILFGYDKPCFFVRGFDLNVGDPVKVEGIINALYSSYLTPFIGQAEITVLEAAW